jgi:thymidylate kinase
MELEDERFHQRVAEAFRAADGGTIVHVRADRSPEAVQAEVWDALARRFPLIFSPSVG